VTLVSFTVLFALGILAAAADVLATQVFHSDFTQQNLRNAYASPRLVPPSLWLGSDELGRSQIVRLIYGTRVSLAVGVGAALINLSIGVLVGLGAGFFRGWLDDVVQFVITTLESIPALFLLLFVAVLFNPGTITLVLILGLLRSPNIALFVRGQTLSLREREFVTAARLLGASHGRLMYREIFPNLLPFVIVLTAIDTGTIILVESALSFLGFGIQPPTPSWGNMLTNAAASQSRGPWLVYGPGAAIFLTVLCLYLIGDGLRDALDPQMHRSRADRPRLNLSGQWSGAE
jgi:peptide/nickel transport system permease protein